MSTDALGTMNAVRVKMGRDPINPFHIEGFGDPGDAPPPPMADLPEPVNQGTEDEFGVGEASAPPSPLVPRQFMGPPQLALPKLMVADQMASYDGHAVELDQEAIRQIAAIVLKAGERKLRERLVALTGKRTRQRRAGTEANKGVDVPADPAAPRVKRKYVRKAKPDADASAGT